ncbi:MAG: DUF835 domain-containing protein [Candidatus Natronoplasma sp.]
MTDLVSMPIKIIPHLRTTIEQMGGKNEGNFAIYHLGFEWGKETVEISGEKSDLDELKTKTVLTAIHSGITNFEVEINESIKIKPYETNIDDDYFLAGYAAGVVSELMGEYHIARIKDGQYEVVKSENKIDGEMFRVRGEREKVELENLESGGSYLIAEEAKEAQRSFETFVNAFKEGMPGLCFTRKFPSKLKEKYPDINCPIFWLSIVDSTEDVKTIKPENLDNEMIKILKAFLKMNQGIVIIHGIEFLISYMEFDDLLNTLQKTRELVSEEGGILLLPANTESLNEDDFNTLKTEFKMFVL